MLRSLMPVLTRARSILAFLVTAAAVGMTEPAELAAQSQAPGGAAIEVRTVKFGQIRAPGGGSSWIETAVELGVTPNPDDAEYGRWADHVRVALSIGIRKRNGDFDFYRAEAEAVSLEAGRSAFRFYLPPEIARREQMAGTEPYAYLVEVMVDGRPLPAGGTRASSVINSVEALRSFKDRVARSATLNDGVLVAQFDSPFADAYPGDTPTFVRR